jgi:hypothetical protein
MIDTPPRWRRAFGMLAAPRLLTALRSRPACATPTAVYATATAPEAANDSAIAASARRSSAEGRVADAALSAACAEAAQQSLEALCHWALLSFPLVSCSGKQRTVSRTDPPRPIRSSTYGTRQSRSPLVGRKCRPPLAARVPSSLLTSLLKISICLPES